MDKIKPTYKELEQQLKRALHTDKHYVTMGDMGAELQKMKDDGMTLESLIYVIGRVWGMG